MYKMRRLNQVNPKLPDCNRCSNNAPETIAPDATPSTAIALREVPNTLNTAMETGIMV